jgi:hypothetical protein
MENIRGVIMHKRKIGFLLLPLAALPWLVSDVHATGTKTIKDVTIDKTNPAAWIASGAIHAARMNQPPPAPAQIKEIGCQLLTFAASSTQAAGTSVLCLAVLRSGGVTTQFACQSPDSGLAAIVAGINVDSVLSFEAPPPATTSSPPGFCTSITIENSSKYWQAP